MVLYFLPGTGPFMFLLQKRIDSANAYVEPVK